ncbi:MAG: hypothetical protein EZS28_047871, partial [Streblomastix strix]
AIIDVPTFNASEHRDKVAAELFGITAKKILLGLPSIPTLSIPPRTHLQSLALPTLHFFVVQDINRPIDVSFTEVLCQKQYAARRQVRAEISNPSRQD